MEIPVRRLTSQSNWIVIAASAIAAAGAMCLSGQAAAEQTKGDAIAVQETRPAAPKPVPVAPPPPSSEEQATLIDDVRQYALNYTHRLPDFICLEQNRRYSDTTGMGAWRLVDVLTARLIFNRQEEYKLISQNGRAVRDQSYGSVDGAISTGDFGSSMYEIFDPGSHATFVWKRWTKLRGRLTHVFYYRIPLEFSKYTLEWGERESNVQKIKVGYRGSIFVDKDLNTIVRIDQEAVNIPPSFPVKQAQETLDYDFTKIGDSEFLLPLVATLEMHSRSAMWTKNVKEFRLYQKFSADAVIRFDGQELPPLPDNKTKEQAPRKSR